MNPELTERNIIELRDHMSLLYNMTRELDGEASRLALMGLCNGVEYTRSEDGRPERMYANHPAGAKCPLHGAHPADGRLRKYVPWKQECLTRDAMERWKQHQELLSRRDHLSGTISSLEQQIARLAREAAWPVVTGAKSQAYR